jgi:arabinoxylan arabinofuranohydrolase
VTEAINIIGQGVNDPHIHVFNDRAYLYASHDHSQDNTRFVMKGWWVWSSNDLLNWQHESTLKPEDIYIGKPMDACWATDAVEKNGKCYWALSDMNREGEGAQIAMVVSDQPGGPWHDPIGGPLLKPDCAETAVYDPCFFKEADGTVYIVFGVWQYYIAKMSDDMLLLC